MTTTEKPKGLALLREPFPANQVSKLPKGTKAQNDCPASEKVNCKVCGGWHHPRIVHLDYVGHAALTDRLLDADQLWTWEPVAFKDGLPAFDSTGGLWIRLTVCGHSRLGYGHAATSAYKDIGSREKEVIGDALRNAAMRFGAALDLWHKGDLHADEAEPEPKAEALPPKIPHMAEFAIADHLANIQAASDMESLQKAHESAKKAAEGAGDTEAFKRFKAATAGRKAILSAAEMAGAV